jgi:hypothetical protein
MPFYAQTSKLVKPLYSTEKHSTSKTILGCDAVNCRKPAKWHVEFTGYEQAYSKDYCDAHCPQVEEI